MLLMNLCWIIQLQDEAVRGVREAQQKTSMPAQVTSHDGMHKTRFASNIWSESCQISRSCQIDFTDVRSDAKRIMEFTANI